MLHLSFNRQPLRHTHYSILSLLAHLHSIQGAADPSGCVVVSIVSGEVEVVQVEAFSAVSECARHLHA